MNENRAQNDGRVKRYSIVQIYHYNYIEQINNFEFTQAVQRKKPSSNHFEADQEVHQRVERCATPSPLGLSAKGYLLV